MKEKIRSTRLRMCFRKMPPAVCFLTLFALCFGALSVRAADPSGRVALTAVRMQRAGGQVYVSFAVKIAPRAVRARHRWVITPCLGNASDSVLLGPFVVTGLYDKYLPMDIYPTYLLKAILAGDIDKMENLGIYEVVEEDFALCEFVDPSKIEMQQIIRDGINLMIKEA